MPSISFWSHLTIKITHAPYQFLSLCDTQIGNTKTKPYHAMPPRLSFLEYGKKEPSLLRTLSLGSKGHSSTLPLLRH